MRFLDGFSGTGSSLKAMRDAGHEVVALERDPKLCARLRRIGGYEVVEADVLELTAADLLSLGSGGPYRMTWWSPPCTTFSVGSFRHHYRANATCRCGGEIDRATGERWVHAREDEGLVCSGYPVGPLRITSRGPKGELGLQLVLQTLKLIKGLQPENYLIENPMGLLRKMMPPSLPRYEITYCQYGHESMKPTDLWGRPPAGWTPRPKCKNGDPCHEAAPLGAKTGTQGRKGAVARGMVPHALGAELLQAIEEAA